MNIGRSILALLVAHSVAILPMATGAGASVQSLEPASVTADMPDCCPPEATPCEKGMVDCGAVATCAAKCFSFMGTSAVIVFPPAFAEMTVSLASSPFLSQTGSPPF